jgi:hypothetical protein
MNGRPASSRGITVGRGGFCKYPRRERAVISVCYFYLQISPEIEYFIDQRGVE